MKVRICSILDNVSNGVDDAQDRTYQHLPVIDGTRMSDRVEDCRLE